MSTSSNETSTSTALSRRRSRTPWVVLGMLAYEPMTGYDLKNGIEATVGHFWQESYGQLYPTLHALHDEGLVSMTPDATGGRARNVYAITDRGHAALRSWLTDEAHATPVRNELLLKIFFASHAERDALRPHLEDALSRAREQQGVLRAVKAGIEREPASDHQRFCWALTVDYGLRNADAVEAWARDALEAFDGTSANEDRS